MSVVSLISGSYCSGEAVRDRVSSRLGLEVINDQVFSAAAAEFDTSRDKLERALAGPGPVFNKLTHEREVHLAYLKVVLARHLTRDGVLLDGCLGHLLPWTVSHLLRVCVIANLDFRVEQAMAAESVSEKEARKRLHAYDEHLLACTSYLFDKPAYDESLFDIVIPMHDRSVDDAVNLIVDYATGDQIKMTDRSLKAAEDFQLTAAVEVALAKGGQRVDVHAEQGHVTLLVNEYTVRLERLKEKLAEIARGVEGVDSVSVRKGPRYRPPSINPWGDIDVPPKILLVDDEKDFVETLSERLLTRDLESAIAYDGEQALSMLAEDAPDVMVLDLMMPGIDGLEVLRRVKREHPQVEVIILTGHGSEREKAEAEELGAFAYLQKPANVDLLARVMREAYEKVNRAANADRPSDRDEQ